MHIDLRQTNVTVALFNKILKNGVFLQGPDPINAVTVIWHLCTVVSSYDTGITSIL